jgi:hypothetical protein
MTGDFSIFLKVFSRSSSMHRYSFYICRVNYIGLKIFKTDASVSSHRVEHNDENRISNGYHMSEINYFKVFYHARCCGNLC